MPIIKVISGGQTGVDQAAWRAAKACGIETGGWMPKGFLTEDGPRPEFAELYGAKEWANDSYPERTCQNVYTADVTLWIGRSWSPGCICTKRAAEYYSKAFISAGVNEVVDAKNLEFLAEFGSLTLNVAGHRESRDPGIGGRVEGYLKFILSELNQYP